MASRIIISFESGNCAIFVTQDIIKSWFSDSLTIRSSVEIRCVSVICDHLDKLLFSNVRECCTKKAEIINKNTITKATDIFINQK